MDGAAQGGHKDLVEYFISKGAVMIGECMGRLKEDIKFSRILY